LGGGCRGEKGGPAELGDAREVGIAPHSKAVSSKDLQGEKMVSGRENESPANYSKLSEKFRQVGGWPNQTNLGIGKDEATHLSQKPNCWV